MWASSIELLDQGLVRVDVVECGGDMGFLGRVCAKLPASVLIFLRGGVVISGLSIFVLFALLFAHTARMEFRR